ncbi:MAG TPA: DUF2007 domain-containing protein [Myxococcota bacterium]
MGEPEVPGSSAAPMSTAAALSFSDEAIVAAFDTVLEAEMARGRLESDGIPARIVDGNTVGIAAHLAMVIGGAKVVVSLSDLEAARTILFSPSTFADEVIEIEAREHDPSAVDIVTRADANASRAMRSAILGLLFFPPLGQLWSLVLLGRVARDRAQLTRAGKARTAVALVVDGGVLAVAAVIAARFF